MMRLKAVSVIAVIGLAGAACHRQPPPPSSSPIVAQPALGQGAAAQPAPPEELDFHGAVRGVDAAAGVVEVRNDDVPGWGMPAMTMTYHVSNPGVLASLKAGDRVAASVHPGDFQRLYNVRLDTQAKAEAAPAVKKDELPPISYVCPATGEENEITDKPGTCEKSPAKLVPIRLTIAYECLKGPAFVQAAPGVCRYDKSELAPITASMFWSCGDSSGPRFLEPGACADGSPREEHFEKRPHGDHNPRHGGPYVAMSTDLLHHAEGTLVAANVYRAYFYDEYTRPMPVSGYVARIAPTDSNAKENGPAVTLGPDAKLGNNVLEGKLPSATPPSKDAPLHFKMHVAVKPGAADWTSDWDFVHYSAEPGAPPATPSTTLATAAPPAPSAPAAASSSPGASPSSTESGGTVGGGAELSPAGPPPQEPVPTTTAGLLQELKTRTDAVGEQLSEGDLGGLWLDALRAKDLAIALDSNHAADIAAADRPELAHAARVLTETAWQIDAAGDLGQAEQINELQKVFADASARIQSLYEAPKH
jgi:Cu/Ag efflux protein CusF